MIFWGVPAALRRSGYTLLAARSVLRTRLTAAASIPHAQRQLTDADLFLDCFIR